MSQDAPIDTQSSRLSDLSASSQGNIPPEAYQQLLKTLDNLKKDYEQLAAKYHEQQLMKDDAELHNQIFHLRSQLNETHLLYKQKLIQAEARHVIQRDAMQQDYQLRLKHARDSYNKQLKSFEQLIHDRSRNDIVNQLQQKLAQFLQQIKRLEFQNTTLERQNMQLRSRLMNLEKQNIQLKRINSSEVKPKLSSELKMISEVKNVPNRYSNPTELEFSVSKIEYDSIINRLSVHSAEMSRIQNDNTAKIKDFQQHPNSQRQNAEVAPILQNLQLRKNIEVLRKELDWTNQQLILTRAQLENSKSQLLSQEVESRTRKLSQSSTKVEFHRQQVQQMAEHISKLNHQIRTLEAENENLKDQIVKLKKIEASSQASQALLQQELFLKNQKIKNLTGEVDFQKTIVIKLQEEALKKVIESDRRSLDSQHRKSLQSPLDSSTDYRQLCEQTTQLNKQLTEEVQRCHGIIEEQRNELQEKSIIRFTSGQENLEKIKNLEKENFSLKRQISQLRLQLTALQEDKKYLESNVDMLRRSDSIRNKSMDQVNAQEINQLKEKVTYLEAKLQQSNPPFQHAISLQSQDNEPLLQKQAVINNLNEQLNDMVVGLQAMQGQVIEKQRIIDKLQSKLTESVDKIEFQRVQQQYRYDHKQSQRILQQHRASQFEARQAAERLQISMAELSDWNELLQSQVAEFKQQRDIILREKTDMSLHCSTIEQQNQAFQKQLYRLQEQRQHLISDVEKLRLEILEAERNLYRKDEQYRNSNQQQFIPLQKEIESQQEEIIKLKTLLQQNRAVLSQTQAKFKQSQDSIELLTEQSELLRMKKAEAQRSAKNISEQKQQLVSQLQDSLKRMEKTVEDNQNLRNQLVSRKEDFDRLLAQFNKLQSVDQNRVVDLENALNQLNQLNKLQKSQYQQQFKKEFDEKTAQFSKLNDITMKLETEIRRVKEDNTRYRDQISIVNRQKADLFREMTKTREINSQLQSLMDQKQQLLEEMQSKIRIMNEQYDRKSVSASRNIDQDLIQYVDELEKRCSMMEEYNRELQKKSISDDGGRLRTENSRLKLENIELSKKLEEMTRMSVKASQFIRYPESLRWQTKSPLSFSMEIPVRDVDIRPATNMPSVNTPSRPPSTNIPPYHQAIKFSERSPKYFHSQT